MAQILSGPAATHPYDWTELMAATMDRSMFIYCKGCGNKSFQCIESSTKGSFNDNLRGYMQFRCFGCGEELEVTYTLNGWKPLEVVRHTTKALPANQLATGIYTYGVPTADCDTYAPLPAQVPPPKPNPMSKRPTREIE